MSNPLGEIKAINNQSLQEFFDRGKQTVVNLDKDQKVYLVGWSLSCIIETPKGDRTLQTLSGYAEGFNPNDYE